LETNLISKKNKILISWNNLHIFKWNNTYLHLYEITCKNVHEIEIHKYSNFFLKGHKYSQKHWKKLRDLFLFQYLRIHKDILKHNSLSKCFRFYLIIYFNFKFGLELTSNKFSFSNCLFVWLTIITHPT